jgi:hypothetical protein
MIEQWFTGVPSIERAVPQNADPIKGGIDGERVDSDIMGFFADWARIGSKFPATYLNATLANTYQGWYPGATITGYNFRGGPLYLYTLDGSSYFIFRTETPGEMREPSVLPAVRDFYLTISKSRVLERVPVVSLLFSPGTMLMLAFLCLTVAVSRNGSGRGFALPALLAILISGTVVLGPVMLVRYFLYLFFCVPLTLAFLARPAVFAWTPYARGAPTDHEGG